LTTEKKLFPEKLYFDEKLMLTQPATTSTSTTEEVLGSVCVNNRISQNPEADQLRGFSFMERFKKVFPGSFHNRL
jgi:hypothetical protein